MGWHILRKDRNFCGTKTKILKYGYANKAVECKHPQIFFTTAKRVEAAFYLKIRKSLFSEKR